MSVQREQKKRGMMWNFFLWKEKNAEVIVYATPIYYYEMCGQMKTLLDRLNPLYSADYLFRDIWLQKLFIRMSIGIMLRWEKIRYRKECWIYKAVIFIIMFFTVYYAEKCDKMLHHFQGKIDIGSGNGGIISQLKMQNEMKRKRQCQEKISRREELIWV